MSAAAAGTYRPEPHRAAAARVPSPLTALAARVAAGPLDRRLASGVESWRSPLYAARALQVTGRRERSHLAAALERLVESAETPPVRIGRCAAITPNREQVRDALPLLLGVAARLRGTAPVRARGIAVLRALLADGCGPCYGRAEPGALRAAIEKASRGLDTEE